MKCDFVNRYSGRPPWKTVCLLECCLPPRPLEDVPEAFMVVTPCSPVEVHRLSEEGTAFIFRVVDVLSEQQAEMLA
jgi:hypothetical protein